MPGLSTGEFDGVILSDAPGPAANLVFALHELFAITSKYMSRSFQETASVESDFHLGLCFDRRISREARARMSACGDGRSSRSRRRKGESEG